MAENVPLTNKLEKSANPVKSASELPSDQEPASLKAKQQLNVWIPKDLMKRLKVKGAETDKSLKELVTEALEKFI